MLCMRTTETGQSLLTGDIDYAVNRVYSSITMLEHKQVSTIAWILNCVGRQRELPSWGFRTHEGRIALRREADERCRYIHDYGHLVIP